MQKPSTQKAGLTLRLHYIKFIIRLTFFTVCAAVYLTGKLRGEDELLFSKRFEPLLITVWIYFALEMCLRAFPGATESIGAKKHFGATYQKPTDTEASPRLQSPWRTALVATVWIVPNAAFGILYRLGIFFDTGLMLLLTLLYAVGDMVCILFFCPFQMWFMKNKCCSSCRIYNWDYAMMFTPFAFIPTPYSLTLFGISLFLLLQWEVLYRLHPERFSESTNASIRCASCTESLCERKRRLRNLFARKKKSSHEASPCEQTLSHSAKEE